MVAERWLLLLYVGGFLCGLVSASSITIVWLYWDATLNSCINVNCGCILYSVVTFSSFVGGAGWFCRYAVFVQLPILFYATIIALYHAYRVFVPKKVPIVRRTVTFNEDGTRKMAVGKRDPPKYSILAVLAVIAAVSVFAQGWIITGGYFATCKEYRKNVSQQIQANGNMAQLVYERLSCSSVYDFLDYLQPDPELLAERYRRTYLVHTAYYLQVSMFTAWLDCIIWSAIAAYNIRLAFCTKPNT